MNDKTVTIFGAFDGIHEGHLEFIRQARTQGEKLVAVVARDSVVNKLKGRNPVNNEVDRIKALLEVPEIDIVLLGDEEEGTYKILKEIKPDLIYLGYDQQSLFDSINLAIQKGILPEIKMMYGTSHNPEVFKSSIINSNKYEG
jgi:FAD synthetase